MAKNKRCRGTGRAKGFDACGVELPFTEKNGIRNYKAKYGLGVLCGCYSRWLLSTKEGKEVLESAKLKATKTRREFNEFVENEKKNKSLGWLLKNTVIACHNFIKKRDYGKPCISCGEPYNSNHQAGHFYKAELFSTLKFNELNIHGQCVGCNIRKDGNESEYRVNLPNRIGDENYKELNILAKEDKLKNHKWDRQELEKIRKYYLDKIKKL
jgi:hypothetical protein